MSFYQPPTVSHKNRELAFILVAVISVAAIAGGDFLGLFGPASSHLDNNSPSWLFKGAYANYSGEIEAQTGVQKAAIGNIAFGYKILDYNSTHLQLQFNYSITSRSENTTKQTTRWFNLGSNSSMFNLDVENYTRIQTYNTTRTVFGKAVYCTAYEYDQVNSTFTVYMSQSLDFPVGFSYFENISRNGTVVVITYDMQLVRTNIGGL